MSTSDQNQPRGGEQGSSGTGAAAAPQAEAGGGERGASSRHGRGRRRSGGGRPEQRQQQPSRRAEPMLNLEEVRELTELFSEHGLTDFEFENADIRIRLSRNPAPGAAAQTFPAPPPTYSAPPPAQASTAQPAPEQQSGQQPAAAATPAPEEALHVITSPIVGTFYRSPSPDAEAFVKAGSQVEVGTVVCIIEAMKLMNEIESDAVGAVAKIYVENGQPVEYGQPLFGITR
jgi:acetyl-CoA carboxylase biotin carboxyl carrier protein